MKDGLAGVTITGGDGAVSVGAVQIAAVAPGLFSADASGRGLPAGYILRVKADGAQSTEAIARFDTTQSKFVAIPIDLGNPTDRVFLVMFGTGLRFRGALANVALRIGGVDAPVNFAGAQGDLVGLDQLNTLLPRGLIGRGEVDAALIVDGQPANVLRISIQ